MHAERLRYLQIELNDWLFRAIELDLRLLINFYFDLLTPVREPI
jgi:hypothetical protein